MSQRSKDQRWRAMSNTHKIDSDGGCGERKENTWQATSSLKRGDVASKLADVAQKRLSRMGAHGRERNGRSRGPTDKTTVPHARACSERSAGRVAKLCVEHKHGTPQTRASSMTKSRLPCKGTCREPDTKPQPGRTSETKSQKRGPASHPESKPLGK